MVSYFIEAAGRGELARKVKARTISTPQAPIKAVRQRAGSTELRHGDETYSSLIKAMLERARLVRTVI